MIENLNFDTMTPQDFEEHLPEFFQAGGKLTDDPRMARFFQTNPDCAALVRDLETIAETAKSLFPTHEPSDAVWQNIASKLQEEGSDESGVTDIAG